ncbi:MAG: phosphatidylglycerol lysyltransferase domain-containing protein [Clostridia bacterium]
MPERKKLDQDNYKEILPYFAYSPRYMSLAKFSTQYIWRHQTGLEYYILDDMLFLFESKFNDSAVCPMGPGDLKKAVDHIFCNEKTGIIYCIGKEQKIILEESYPVVPYRDFFEYVYFTKDQVELKGRRYNKKRNHINKFHSLYQHEYKRIDCHDHEEIRKVIGKWCENSDFGDEALSCEKNAITELLSNEVDIGCKAASVYINGKMVAFTIGEQIFPDMVVVHFEKADTEFQGLYQTMAREYLANEWPDIKYVNRQEDMGIPGLRKAKESYYPEFYVENHCIRKEGQVHQALSL